MDHSRTFTELSISHSCCVFRFIVLLEGKPSAQSEDLNALDWFSLRLSLYFGALSFSSTLTSPSVPAAEKQLHIMRLLPAHFTFGMILCMWWTVPGFLQTWCLNWASSDQIILFLKSEGPLGAFFFCANSKCVFMCLTWREDWTLPHCHKAQIVGVLQWCLSFCRFLLSPHMIVEFNYCDHQVLRHHSNQSLHHQWFSLARGQL